MYLTGQKVADLTDAPVKVDFSYEQVDAWYKSEVTDAAWVYKEGDEIVALSPVCKHLGCTVNWAGDSAHPDQFFCACHAGRYEKTGVNIPGTPPTGHLDQYEVAEKDGYLMLGKKIANTFSLIKLGGTTSVLNKIYDWVDERLDITPIWRDIADHEVPEHVNPAHHFSAFVYCFGGLTFFITVIQILIWYVLNNVLCTRRRECLEISLLFTKRSSFR